MVVKKAEYAKVLGSVRTSATIPRSGHGSGPGCERKYSWFGPLASLALSVAIIF